MPRSANIELYLSKYLINVKLMFADDILECYSGYIVESDIFTYNNWRLMRCADASQKCVRAEGAATLYNVVNGKNYSLGCGFNVFNVLNKYLLCFPNTLITLKY